jgi:hypothetical protein
VLLFYHIWGVSFCHSKLGRSSILIKIHDGHESVLKKLMRFSSLAQPIALSLRLRGGADQTAGKDNVIVFRVSFFIETKNTHYVSFLRMLCNHVFCGKFSLLAWNYASSLIHD